MPVLGLGQAFDHGVPFHQKRFQLFAQKHSGSQPSEKSSARGKADFVSHASAIVHGGEVVIMLEVPEGSGDHDVPIVAVGPQLFDEAGVPPAHAEVTPSEGQPVSFADGLLGRSCTAVVPH